MQSSNLQTVSVGMAIKALIAKALNLYSVTSSVSWPWVVRESYTGAWQRNREVELDSRDNLLRNSAVYACVTGIASDVAKMQIKLSRNEKGIWEEIAGDSPFWPVLRRPNHYQNRIQFVESWILSKLLNGNAYILLERDGRGIVNAMYPLDPLRVTPLVTSDGSVYYRLQVDHLSRVEEADVVPASEVIHDRMCCLWHPLVGVPPLYACAISATLGNRIYNDSTTFFQNRSMPGGMLLAPGQISKETAEELKQHFEERYSGQNAGRLLVLGDNMKFEALKLTAENAQLVEQFKMSVEDVARAFHYPLFKLGGPLPAYAGNTEALIITYYTDCLQTLIEKLELCLDEGLALPAGMGTELDLDGLMRMDTKSLYESNNSAVGGGWMAPDEARFKANFRSVTGGASPMMQQQNYSLAALAKRDARDDPWETGKQQPALPPEPKIVEVPVVKELSPEEDRARWDHHFAKDEAA